MLVGPLITGGLQGEATAAREQAEDTRDRAEALESQLQEKVMLGQLYYVIPQVQSASLPIRQLHVALRLISCHADHLLSTVEHHLILLNRQRNIIYQLLSTAHLYYPDWKQELSLVAISLIM